MSAVPQSAKRKVIRRRRWEGVSTPEPVVYLDDKTSAYARRLGHQGGIP